MLAKDIALKRENMCKFLKEAAQHTTAPSLRTQSLNPKSCELLQASSLIVFKLSPLFSPLDACLADSLAPIITCLIVFLASTAVFVRGLQDGLVSDDKWLFVVIGLPDGSVPRCGSDAPNGSSVPRSGFDTSSCSNEIKSLLSLAPMTNGFDSIGDDELGFDSIGDDELGNAEPPF